MSTPRFDLETYQQGDDNWSHTDTVELLDELAVETDTISNRPASGNYDDELFFATDQKLLYRWDNSESDWLIEGGIGTESDRLPNVWADEGNFNTLEADRVNTAPTGVAVKLDENQNVADDTVTNVEWMTEVESRGEVNNILNEDNNAIEIPSGYNWAQVSVSLRFDTDPNLDIFRPSLNEEFALGWGSWLRGTTTGAERISRTTGFASVSEGDEITTQIRHQNGSSVEIREGGNNTAMVVWLL